MKIQYSTQFAKDARKLPQHIKTAVKEIVIQLENAQNLFEIRDCRTLVGVKNGYRIRRGNYRVTLSLMIQDDTVMLLRVLPRGQVYKKHI
ncbi:MAG: type II toxin-antitoxin system RelE/ParE family toxin [Dysgonamonadaceae bacterium]|jgi:mRNA-degrading endonuclease RelE of RelBE toxin-antitoxin system|nr:type II toxin-antitoxin system RelE/ParE family toxin [Dysgonamonadaceae bacterium]